MEQNTQTNASSSKVDADNVIKFGRTQPQIKDFTYIWVIKYFARLKDCSLFDQKFNIKSPTFTFYNGDDKYELQIIAYPAKSEYDIIQDFLHLNLQLISSPNEAKNVWIQLSLVDSEGNTLVTGNKKYTRIKNDDSEIYTFTHVLTSTILREFGNECDELRVKCLIQFFNGVMHNGSAENAEAEVMSRLSILNDFEALYKSTKFSDVKLIVRGQEFPAHKSILATRSRVFSAMFEHEMKESKDNVVNLDQEDPDIMAEVLHFIYTGNVRNIEKLATELLAAADRYLLDALRLLCEEALIAKLSLQNFGGILKLVDLYETTRLHESAMKFLAIHGSEFAAMEDYDEIMKTLSPTMLLKVTKVLIMRKPL